jgi:hypothetical protein
MRLKAGCDLDRAPEHGGYLILQPKQVEEGHGTVAIDEQIKIAPLGVIPPRRRTEHARIANRVTRNDGKNLIAMLGQGLRGAHFCLLSRRFGVSALGQAVLALLLIALGVDGLFLGLDLVGQVVYATGLEPSLARPGLIALLVGSAALAALER